MLISKLQEDFDVLHSVECLYWDQVSWSVINLNSSKSCAKGILKSTVFLQWEVGAAVLEILHKLLSSHQVFREDFVDVVVETPGGGQEGAVANKPPGHTLLLHMLNDSAMLRMVSVRDQSLKIHLYVVTV